MSKYTLKTYYKCELTQLSPLHISNGDNEKTDSDLFMDSRGLPQIPGTSIAGVFRSQMPKDVAKRLFGVRFTSYDKAGSRKLTESRVIFSAAVLPDNTPTHISQRDGVGITEDGTAKDKAKYNFQIVETEGVYTCIIEIDRNKEDEDADVFEAMLKRISLTGISFGAKTTRGFGNMAVKVYKRTFDLSVKDETSEDGIYGWLKFDPFDDAAFAGADPLTADEKTSDEHGRIYTAKISIDGKVIVRVYSSDVGGADYSPLMAHKGDTTAPVIPGTSWAGAFRHHMLQLSECMGMSDRKEEINAFFGTFDDNKKKQRSRIMFSETTISGGKSMRFMRNALDRFTQAPKNNALFTSDVWCGGNGELTIRVTADADEQFIRLLEASLLDLHFGLMAIGGESSIGYGRARIDELWVNGKKSDTLLGQKLKEETV